MGDIRCISKRCVTSFEDVLYQDYTIESVVQRGKQMMGPDAGQLIIH